MRHKIQRAGLTMFSVKSAGTSAYHIGDKPDSRTIKEGNKAGYDFTGQYARQVLPTDFFEYDLILAMDRDNLTALKAMSPTGATSQLRLLLDFHPDPSVQDVPDPYYGGQEGFTRVITLVEDALDSLITYYQ